MKKLKYLLLMVLFIPFIANAATGLNNIDYSTCTNKADFFRSIVGKYEYTTCYRAGCSTSPGGTTGTWTLANMRSSSGYSCANGNPNPYSRITSSGCTQYKGACTVNPAIYCTEITTVNCDLKADGTPYIRTSTPSTPDPDKPDITGTKTVKPTKKTVSRPTGSKVIITTGEKTTTGNNNTRPVVTTEETTTEPQLSGNVNVNAIYLNGTDIKYHNEYSEYTIKLKKGIRELDVSVITEDPNSVTYIDGANNMSDEDSTITITVTAENGNQKQIFIHVKRYEGESSDCNIANIAISDYEINHFDKNNFDYTLNVKGKTKSLNMEIIPSDPLHADYEVQGNEKLENNSVITIQVKAEDGNMCYYHIKIRKTSSFWLILFIIIIVTIGLLLAGYFVYRYLKRSKNQYEYE